MNETDRSEDTKVNEKGRPHMSPADRAKQFMPFAALKGLPEALAQKEKIIVPKIELSEDYRDELDRILSGIRLRDIITIVYFHDGCYIRTSGMVSRIDTLSGYIQIVNRKIYFKDIYSISK